MRNFVPAWCLPRSPLSTDSEPIRASERASEVESEPGFRVTVAKRGVDGGDGAQRESGRPSAAAATATATTLALRPRQLRLFILGESGGRGTEADADAGGYRCATRRRPPPSPLFPSSPSSFLPSFLPSFLLSSRGSSAPPSSCVVVRRSPRSPLSLASAAATTKKLSGAPSSSAPCVRAVRAVRMLLRARAWGEGDELTDGRTRTRTGG